MQKLAPFGAAFLGCLVLTSVVLAQGPARPAEPLPTWAFPSANPADAVFARKDDGKPLTMPGSARQYTVAQINDPFNPPDWHPDDHPPPPSVVVQGRPPIARACGQCHLPTGTGHPESSYLAGLPANYIVEQMNQYRNGNRRSSLPARSDLMIALAKAWSDDDIRQAAEYFARLPRRRWVRVVESDTVPRTIGPGAMRFLHPEGGTEPLAGRIIEFAEERQRAESRDARSGFVAYVPVGSIKRGENLVTTGGATAADGKVVAGKTTQCTICHRRDLKGIGEVPGLVGLHPIYVVRQLYDIKHGARKGPAVELMQDAVAELTLDDMVDIAAYLASLDPGGPDMTARVP